MVIAAADLTDDLLKRSSERIKQQDELIAILLTALNNFINDDEAFNCAYCPAESTCIAVDRDVNQDYCMLQIIIDAYRDIGASDIWRYRNKDLERALSVWLDNKDLTPDTLWDVYCTKEDPQPYVAV